MGRTDNRQALLRGARQCIDEQGYARTTARNVTAAAGVSTAAIGYHFGTIDALLVTALLDGMEEWSAQLGEQMASIAELPASDRLAALYTAAVESFSGYRGVLAASFELIARADANEDVRRRLRESVQHAREELARLLFDLDPDVDEERTNRTGAVCYAILSGLMVQWLVDPEGLPGPGTVGEDLTTGIQNI